MAQEPAWLSQSSKVDSDSWLDQVSKPVTTSQTKKDLPLGDVTDVLSALGETATSLPTTVTASFGQMYEGTMNPWQKGTDSIERQKAMRDVQREAEAAQAEAEASGEASIASRAIRSGIPSYGFTGAIMPASIVAGGATGLATAAATRNPATAQRAAMAAGTAASGYAAYRMASAQFLDDARERIDNFFLEKAGRLPNEKEQEEAYQELLPLAREMGMAEALPEAFGNLALAGAGKYIYRILGGKTGVQQLASGALSKVKGLDALKSVGAGVAGTGAELTTEGITEVLQQSPYTKLEEGVMRGVPVESVQTEPFTLERLGEGIERVAEPTLATTLLMGGLGAVGTAGYRRATRKDFEQNDFRDKLIQQSVTARRAMTDKGVTEADKANLTNKAEEAEAALKALNEGRSSDVEKYFNVRFIQPMVNPAISAAQGLNDAPASNPDANQAASAAQAEIEKAKAETERLAAEQAAEAARIAEEQRKAAASAIPKANVPPPPSPIITPDSTIDELQGELIFRQNARKTLDFGDQDNAKIDNDIQTLTQEIQSRSVTPPVVDENAPLVVDEAPKFSEEALRYSPPSETSASGITAESLPPIPEGMVRLTHATSGKNVGTILESNKFDFSKQGVVDATTDSFGSNQDLADRLNTSAAGVMGRTKFGDKVIIMDVPVGEHRKMMSFSEDNPGTIPASRIVAVYDSNSRRLFTPESRQTPPPTGDTQPKPPAEAPAISPKPPVSPAAETAPISETQPPQGQLAETPTDAAPKIPLEESLRQEPQDRVESRKAEEAITRYRVFNPKGSEEKKEIESGVKLKDAWYNREIDNLSSISGLSNQSVHSVMLPSIHDGEVLKSVVTFIPVDVMNDLRVRNIPADELFDNPNMLRDTLASYGENDIFRRVVSALGSGITGLRAELLKRLGGSDLEGAAALIARFKNPSSLASLLAQGDIPKFTSSTPTEFTNALSRAASRGLLPVGSDAKTISTNFARLFDLSEHSAKLKPEFKKKSISDSVQRAAKGKKEVDRSVAMPPPPEGVDKDIIDYVLANWSIESIGKKQRGKRRTTGEVEAFERLSQGLPLPARNILFSPDRGRNIYRGNLDIIAQAAFDKNLISAPDANTLTDAILDAYDARKSGASLFIERSQREQADEQRRAEFEKAIRERTAPLTLIPARDLEVGDVVQIGDDNMRVTLESDEDGISLTAAILTGPKFGEQRIDPNKPLKAEKHDTTNRIQDTSEFVSREELEGVTPVPITTRGEPTDATKGTVTPRGAATLSALEQPPVEAATEAPQSSPNLPALVAVRDNAATPEQVQSLADQGLVEQVDGQNIITEAGVAEMPEDQRPKLTPAERRAEVEGMAAPVAQPPAEAPAAQPLAAEAAPPVVEPAPVEELAEETPAAVEPPAPEPEAEAQAQQTIESEEDVEPDIDAAISSSLTDEEKIVAAEELGQPEWNQEAVKSFKQTLADWSVGVKQVSERLAAIFQKVLDSAKAVMVTLGVFIGSGVNTDTGITPFSSAKENVPVYKVADDLMEIERQRIDQAAEPMKVKLERPSAAISDVLGAMRGETVAIEQPPAIRREGEVALTEGRQAPFAKRANFRNVAASSDATLTADWIVSTNDNKGMSFLVADKVNGAVFIFDGEGNLVRKTSALFGKNVGDQKPLDPWTERTTPSGRFEAEVEASEEYGQSVSFYEPADGDAVLAIHKVYLEEPAERRQQRLDSKTPADNRISYGCINVDERIFNRDIAPAFADGGIVYVLPETKAGRKKFAPTSLYDQGLADLKRNKAELKKQEKIAKEEAQKNQEIAQSSLKALFSLISGEKTNATTGNVTLDDANTAMRQIEEARELPNIYFTNSTTREEFLADPANESRFPAVWADLKANPNIEGLFDPTTGTAFVFTDKVAVSNLDRKLAEFFGTTPEVAAVRRVLIHESLHKGLGLLSTLDPSAHTAVMRYLNGLFTPEMLDARVADGYTQYSDWRINPDSKAKLIEEVFTEKISTGKELPKDGLWGEFIAVLKQIWRSLTGKRGEPTVQDMKDVMRLITNSLRNEGKQRPDRTVGDDSVRFAIPVTHTSESAAISSSAQNAVTEISYTPRDFDVSLAIRRAFDNLTRSAKQTSVTLEMLYNEALKGLGNMTRDEFGRMVQKAYDNNSALLTKGTADFPVFNRDGDRAGSVVLMARGPMASMIPPDAAPAASDNLRNGVDAAFDTENFAKYTGVPIKGRKAQDHISPDAEKIKEAAIQFVSEMIDARVQDGSSSSEAVMEVADTVANGEFGNEYLMGLPERGREPVWNYMLAELESRLRNASLKAAKRGQANTAKQLEAKSERLVDYWYSLGTQQGSNLQSRQAVITNPRYAWMFAEKEAKQRMQKNAEEAVAINAGDPGQLGDQVNRNADETDAEAGVAAGKKFDVVLERNQDAIDLAAGEATLEDPEKSLYEEYKNILRRRGILDMLDKRDASAAMASISAEERSALAKLTKAERDEMRKKDDKRRMEILAKLLGAEEDAKTPEQKTTREKRKRMVKVVEKITFREGKDVEFRSVSTQDAVADLFNGADEYGKIVEEVGDALLSRVKQARGAGGAQTAIKQLVESIKRTLLGNLPTPKPAPPTNASLGKMLAMTFAQQIREAGLYADAWSKGRTEVRNLLAETGLKGEALENELDSIMPPTPALAYAPNAARRTIALAMEQAGVTREQLTDGRINVAEDAKAKVMEAFDQAAAAVSLSEQGWSKQGKTGRQLAEQALNEAVQQWNTQDSNRVKISRIVAEQSESPVSEAEFADKLKSFNLKPAEITKLFDRAKNMAARRIELSEARAQQLIYALGEQFRQGSKDPDKSAGGDSINRAFRDQVSEPMTLDEFIQRLAKLNVGETVATRLFRTAAKERIDRKSMMIFDMLTGPRAASQMLERIARARRGIEMPLRSPISFVQLLSQKARTVNEYRKKVLDQIMASPDFADATEEQKERLADLFASVWQDQYAKIFAAKQARLEQSLLAKGKDRGAEALKAVRNEILESINLGVFNNDLLVRLMGEKFGIKTSFTEAEKARITELGEALQDDSINKALRNRMGRELVILMAKATNIPIAEILSNWWVSSVLSGLNTVFSIGAAFTNGAYEILGLGPVRAIQKLLDGDMRGAVDNLMASVRGLGRYLKAFPEAFNRAWQYLWSGDVALLESAANDPLARIKTLADINRYESVAEILSKDPSAMKRFIGLYTRFWGRLLAALDAFNVMVTKRGALSIALRQSDLSIEQIRDMEEKVGLDIYKSNIVKTDPYFKGRMPRAGTYESALLNSMAEAQMYASLTKLGANIENADFTASQAAMTLNPSGAGGFIYNALMGINAKSTSLANDFVRYAKARQSGDNKRTILDELELALAYFVQFAAYQAANILGYRFARFAGNKFNQGVSFLPFIGMLRMYEKNQKQLKGSEAAFVDSIYRNQMISFVMLAVGQLVIKAIADEPDDEKRGWSWNGGWGNLTPEQIKQKLSAGEKQFTIRIGDRVFNYQNWPVNQMFAAIGSISDMIRFSPKEWADKGYLEGVISTIVAGVSATMEIPALTQAGEIFGRSFASKDPTEQAMSRVERLAAGWLGGFTPRILKDLDMMADPKMRKYKTIWEKTASHIPIYRRFVGEEYYDILGKQIEKEVYPGSREFMERPSDPAYRILGALNSRNIWLTPANAEYRMVGKGRNRRRLTQEEADAYSLETGKAYKSMILRYGPRALQMSTERARAFLSDKADEVRDRALQKVYRGYRSRTSAQ